MMQNILKTNVCSKKFFFLKSFDIVPQIKERQNNLGTRVSKTFLVHFFRLKGKTRLKTLHFLLGGNN